MGSRSPDKPPETLSLSITAMLRLFAERAERDVGGAAIAYLLGPNGAYLCGYGYSVSDPITPNLRSGDLIPHGTSPGGGFGLSVTEYDKEAGIIVYWLQKPGGVIYLRTPTGFENISIDGSPSEFRRDAESRLGLPVEIWFGDSNPRGQPDSIHILTDENGKQAISISRYGHELQFSAIFSETLSSPKPGRARWHQSSLVLINTRRTSSQSSGKHRRPERPRCGL